MEHWTDIEGRIGWEEVLELILQELQPSYCFIADNFYILKELRYWNWIFKKDQLDKRFYQRDIFDCDDFAFAIMGRMRERHPGTAFGYLWTRSHAMNFFIPLDDKHIFLYEPQTDAFGKIIGFKVSRKIDVGSLEFVKVVI